ncbi:PIR protein [Plasmodium reichenowi]|uniref:PIR protein n=1 Tax=Plasmodium reichenowi TaxID=5854 RepID=A0A2P9DRT5_PLARE|nr:PIR protein [Plasmodium reichenowi]
MKVHYINILFFALPLNILIYNQRNHYTTRHKPTTRVLCECQLYMPNYDNDPEMKKIMQKFEDRTTERFHEYDDRMKTKRQKCKDQCDKQIHKIILKDKLEKELTEKFTTLHTDIQSDAIPTCICEKSMADKVEKGCLRCGGILGAAMPEIGSIGGSLLSALYTWKPKALEAAIAAGQKSGEAAGIAAGIDAGVTKAIEGIIDKFGLYTLNGISLNKIIVGEKFKDVNLLSGAVQMEYKNMCTLNLIQDNTLFSLYETTFEGDTALINNAIVGNTKIVVRDATTAATQTTETTTQIATATAIETNKGIVEATFSNLNTAIISSIVAIVVIVLVMLIIYLILRYRRKKKMKKKLKFIKLLKE